MFEQAFKNIDDIFHKDAGCSSELDYTEQTSWMLFLKYLDPGRSLGKTNPLNDNDLKEFVKLQKGFKESDKSWSLNVADIDEATWDCSVKNPNAEEEAPLREPKEIIALDKESEAILNNIKELI